MVSELKNARISHKYSEEDAKLKEASGALESTYDHLVKAGQLFTCFPAIRNATGFFTLNASKLPLIGYHATGAVGIRVNLIKPKNPKLAKYSYFIVALEYQGIMPYETDDLLSMKIQTFDGNEFKRLNVYKNPDFAADFDLLANRHKIPSRFEPKSMTAMHAAFLPGSLSNFSINNFSVSFDSTNIPAPNLLYKGKGI